MMLALLETGDLQQKLTRLGERREFHELSQAGAEIAAKFRKYMVVRTLMSALVGVAVWAFALLTGLDLPVAWGIIAFALNYIPFIGSFAAIILPGSSRWRSSIHGNPWPIVFPRSDHHTVCHWKLS